MKIFEAKVVLSSISESMKVVSVKESFIVCANSFAECEEKVMNLAKEHALILDISGIVMAKDYAKYVRKNKKQTFSRYYHVENTVDTMNEKGVMKKITTRALIQAENDEEAKELFLGWAAEAGCEGSGFITKLNLTKVTTLIDMDEDGGQSEYESFMEFNDDSENDESVGESEGSFEYEEELVESCRPHEQLSLFELGDETSRKIFDASV